jgi:isomaltose glucohydrolase
MSVSTRIDLGSDPLLARSIEVLREGQAESGAFVASPNFDVYRFGWLRDGAFCAYAMELAGESHSAGRFHAWVAQALNRQRARIERVVGALAAEGEPDADDLMPARFTLDGWPEPPDDEPWPNFQLDGYGMWLWALEHHLGRGGDGASWPELASAADLCARYLEHAWRLPCWGCWEEFDDGEHAATLAAIAAGLDAAGRLLDEPRYGAVAGDVRHRLIERFVVDGRFRRCASDDRVDGSLLWLAQPFGVLPLEDERIRRTIAVVRADLAGPGGGVYRYLGDTYYGGGQWILLTCWLGWVDATMGETDAYSRSREWVRAQALPNGDLPEQVTGSSQHVPDVARWTERWGPVATPLLWSHAMYIAMEVAAGAARWTSYR